MGDIENQSITSRDIYINNRYCACRSSYFENQQTLRISRFNMTRPYCVPSSRAQDDERRAQRQPKMSMKTRRLAEPLLLGFSALPGP